MYTPLHRMTIMTALASALLAATLSGPAAARPIDLRSEAQTSSLAGTTARQDLRNPDNRASGNFRSYPVATPPARQDRRSPDALDPTRPSEVALALERYYSSYGEPVAVAEAPAPVGEDTPWLPIVIAIAATLAIVAASATHLRRLRVRRRRTAGAVS